MEDLQGLELDQANSFMHWVTLGNFTLLEKLDKERPSRRGGNPDFRFKDDGGKEYALEITRLMNRQLRGLEKFVMNHVSAHVNGQLPGTYLLEVHVDSTGRGKIAGKAAEDTVGEILRLIQSGSLGHTHCLSTGFVLCKVREDGSRLVPWLLAPEVRYDLALTDPIAGELEEEFRGIAKEADQKFKDYDGARILLIGLSQSGLNYEFHASRFKGGQGIMLTWAEDVGKGLANVDYIYLEPGITVWQPAPNSGDNLTLLKVFAGHRYANSKAGHYVLLWQRTGSPRLLC